MIFVDRFKTISRSSNGSYTVCPDDVVIHHRDSNGKLTVDAKIPFSEIDSLIEKLIEMKSVEMK